LKSLKNNHTLIIYTHTMKMHTYINENENCDWGAYDKFVVATPEFTASTGHELFLDHFDEVWDYLNDKGCVVTQCNTDVIQYRG